MGLEIEKLSHRQGDVALLDAIDLALARARRLVLLGPRGSGKTTLLRSLAGLERPAEGRIVLEGEDVTRAPPARRSVALVVAGGALYPNMDVYRNIAAAVRGQALSRDATVRRVREAAAALGLDGLLGRYPDELDLERRQRCAIARALAKQPALLLFDEPFDGVDPVRAAVLRAELRALLDGSQSSAIIAATDPADALFFGEELAVIGEGRILQRGAAAALYATPGSIPVARALSNPPINLFEADLRQGFAKLGRGAKAANVPLDGPLAALGDGRFVLGVRAEALAVVEDGAGYVQGGVALVEALGAETFLHVDLGRTTWIARLAGGRGARVGDRVGLAFDPRSLLAFFDTGALAAAPSAGHG